MSNRNLLLMTVLMGSVAAAQQQAPAADPVQVARAALAAAVALVVFKAHLLAEELSAVDALLGLGVGHGSRGLLPEAADFYRRRLGIRERR